MIFITGTDTGCGKTTVGRGIAAALRSSGHNIAVFKPIETGCEEVDGELLPVDARALAQAAGCSLPIEDICPYRLRMPASPERAARAEGRVIELPTIVSTWERIRSDADEVIVEGAGGLLVPITRDVMMVDLPALLGIPVLVVARDALGTVNHTLLTIEAIRSRGLELIGIVLSSTDQSQGSSLENFRAIAELGQVRIIGTMPHLPDADDDRLARAARDSLDLDVLFEDQ